MPALPAPGFVADLILAQASPLASLAAVAGLGAAGVLGWLLWRTRRDYSMQLTEQSQQVAEEQAKARQAAAESQAKAEMLATLSREIRAHLNGVIGSADLLLD